MTPLDILSLTGPELIHQAQQRLVSGAGAARDIYRAAVLDGRFAPETLGLNTVSVQAWRDHFRLALPQVHEGEAAEAANGGQTTKLVLELEDGLEVECVRIPMRGGRFTLCVSSQVGCRLGCAFCETAKMGFLRNLTAAEIVAQVVVARGMPGWSVESVVFMGMGEPLDNIDNVIQALQVLHDPHGLNYGRRRLTVCTAGLPEGIRRLGELGWRRLGLAVSLSSACEQTRQRLMPIARRVSLAELQRALLDYPRRGSFVLGINYCLLPGINDSQEAAQRVARFVAPLGRTLVTVIPNNPGSESIAPAASDEDAERFARLLQGAGIAATQRATKGRSVMAACGQLGNLGLRSRPGR